MATVYRVAWPQCAFTDPANGETTVLDLGEEVPDWVDASHVAALVTIGAVVSVEQADLSGLLEASGEKAPSQKAANK